mgnify:CR=1 FL=1
MLSEELHTTLPYETVQSVRNRMYQIAPNLVRIGFFEPNSFFDVGKSYHETCDGKNILRNDVVLKSTRRANVAADYWMTGKNDFANQKARLLPNIREPTHYLGLFCTSTALPRVYVDLLNKQFKLA